MATALLTTPALYAQVRSPGAGKVPSGPSTSAPLGPGGLPGELCSGGGSGPTGPTGVTGASGSDDPAGGTGSTCSGPVGGSSVTSQFELQGCEGIITDANVGLDVTHSWVGDLVITLTSPDNTTVTIVDQPGAPPGEGCQADNVFAVLDDAASTPVEDECAAATPTIDGTFQPNNPLADFNGEAGNGIWVLNVSDAVPEFDSGFLNDWSLDLTCGEPVPRATFEVNKVFTDGNPGEVDVTLNCFTGLPLTQTQTISEDQNVVFVVTDYDDGELDCEVVEEDVSGYSAEYNNGETTDDESCAYEDVNFSATHNCTITNSPVPQAVEVEKDWVIEGSGGDDIDPGYRLKLYCDNEIVDGYEGQYNWSKTLYNDDSNGIDDSWYGAYVVPDWENGTQCWVEEDLFDSAVEVSNGCENLLVEIGSGDSCTITNTVFYEGIPTLSNYGLALLTLMMLGVGFVGFRRFA